MVPCTVLHIADLETVALRLLLGQGLHLSEQGLHRVSLILYISRYHCMFQCTKCYISKHPSISQGPRQMTKYCCF